MPTNLQQQKQDLHQETPSFEALFSLEGIGRYIISLTIIIIKGIIVSVFIDKDEEEREKIRRSVRDQAGVDTEDLLFPSPSGSSISQGTKRKVCYTYTLHIFDTLFWGHNILFSRRNSTANLYLESNVAIYFQDLKI